MPSAASSFIAGGNIPPARFVQVTTPNRTVIVCASGSPPIGISANNTHNVPGTIGGVAIDDGYTAISGMSVGVYTTKADECWLELGGTVAYGDYLKADAGGLGKGIVGNTDADNYGARALAAGVSGQLIKVQLTVGFHT